MQKLVMGGPIPIILDEKIVFPEKKKEKVICQNCKSEEILPTGSCKICLNCGQMVGGC